MPPGPSASRRPSPRSPESRQSGSPPSPYPSRDGRHRLLRDPRRRPRRDRGPDQEGIPEPGPAMAPGRQQGSRGGGPVQGDQRGLPGPVRPRAAPALRPVRDGGRPRAGRAPGSAASPTSSMPSSEPGRPGPGGAAGRLPARTSGTTSGSRSRRPSSAPRRRSSFPVLARCETCGGNGAKPGTEPITCPQCNGRGEVRGVRQTMLGQMINVTTCPRCKGDGRIVETKCETCAGEGRVERQRTLQVSIPPGSTRATRSGSPTRARPGPGRPGGPPLRRGPRGAAPDAEARGHRADLRGDASGWRRRRSGRRSPSRPSTARRTSRSRRARSPAPRSGSAAGRAAPPPVGAARRPARHRRRRGPASPLARPARGPRGLREGVGRDRDGGWLLERAVLDKVPRQARP